MTIFRPFAVLSTVVTIAWISSCSSYQTAYHIPLRHVRAFTDVHDMHTAAMSNPAQAQKLDAADDIEHFRQEAFGITAHVTTQDIQITLTNTSTELITIDWKAGVYVDEDGKEFGLVRHDVHPRFTDHIQPITLIQPGHTVIERCYPTKCIAQYGRSYSLYPFLPSGAFGNPQALQSQLHTLVGKELKLFLPVRVGATLYKVEMDFVIKHATVLPQ